jgi:hypothetical protein
VRAILPFCLSCLVCLSAMAEEQQQPVDYRAASEACSGVMSVNAQGERSKITVKGVDLEITADNSLEIRRSGVLLSKVEKYTAQDLTECIERVIKASK